MRFSRLFLSLATALSLAAGSVSPVAAQPAAAAKPAPGAKLNLPELQTWELPNGMKVAFMQVDVAPVVAVEVWYHVGAKDEPRNRRGSAHMFEHMMFKGTKNVMPEEHARHLNRLGGYVNAATSEDATYYVNVLPSDYVDFAIQLEAERMRNLVFRKSMIKTEREVVKEEIRQQENNPVAKGFLRFLEIAFTKHPYAWTAGGTIADLDATSLADLKSFYDTYYVPNNAMLVVVGATTRAKVEAAANTYFASVPKGAAPPRPADAAPEPAQTRPLRETVAPGQIGILLDGFKIPDAKHPDIYALQLLSLILGGGESSRLHRRLVRDDKIALQAGAPALVREHPGLFILLGVYLDPSKAGEIEAALNDEVKALIDAPPTEEELRKVKNQTQAGFVFGLEGVDGLAQQIGTSWILTGDPSEFLADLANYEAVTAADIQRVAKTYLAPNAATVVIIPPQAQGN